MINGLGVLGWGVGGIEAEAAMLGQPRVDADPAGVGFRLFGRLPEGATATDLVLTVTQMLRKKGVVGKFVEFFGQGLDQLPLADRATIANMAPEYGATCGFFPVDQETLNYLRLTGRPEALVRRVEAYCKEQGIFRTPKSADPLYTDILELDLASVRAVARRPGPAAGPRRARRCEEVVLRRAAELASEEEAGRPAAAARSASRSVRRPSVRCRPSTARWSSRRSRAARTRRTRR